MYSNQNSTTRMCSDLVDLLFTCPNYSVNLLNSMKNYNWKPSHVRKMCLDHNHIFLLDNETIRLKPDLDVCNENSKDYGCPARMSCNKLHMCIAFIKNVCTNGNNCVAGHQWTSHHNKCLLEKYCLDHLNSQELKKYFCYAVLKCTLGGIKLCEEYNDGNCMDANCSELHICINLLLGNCSAVVNQCNLNHNFQSEVKKLAVYGLTVNETPLDIKNALMKMTSISEQLKSAKIKQQANLEKDSCSSLSMNKKDCVISSSTNNNGDNGFSLKSSTEEKMHYINLSTNLKSEEKTTKWSHHFFGNVQTPEICYNSVEGRCDKEATVCPRLHATDHFHWQVQDKQNNWLNLPNKQLLELEIHFCNVNTDSFTLAAINPSEMELEDKRILLLLGRIRWAVNFITMELSHKDHGDILKIRRLCTEQKTGISIKPNIMEWYFLDKNKTWVKYGNVDTTGEEQLKSSMNSSDIEKHFLANPIAKIQFQSSKFSYELDFSNMTQKNTETNVVRAVRRRPVAHIAMHSPILSGSLIPLTWDAMSPDERSKKVVISNSSDEYKQLQSLIQSKGHPLNLIKIERIQNLFLWKALQNKIQELTVVHKSKSAVNIQQLFHGTNEGVVQKICDENFDWRLYGTNSGNLYGQGSYFTPFPKTANSYSKADARGHKYMFVARVAVGSVTLGNAKMTRPPENAQTKLPYDSTADHVDYPNIIVKYDKQEYYPEYLITYT